MVMHYSYLFCHMKAVAKKKVYENILFPPPRVYP